jgi:PHD/YefM family antitoxin component YafN of YafNO toxin-antitoxin module
MTYTLFMPADQRIQIADDGVAEVPMTHARAALTALIREVSWGKRPGAFTERGSRVAMVVPTEEYDDIAVLRELRLYLEELEASDKPPAPTNARVLREALDIAKRRALDST